jgi:hypothetical protein
MFRFSGIALLATLLAACGDNQSNSCDPVARTGCSGSQVCEPVGDGKPACFAPVVVQGTVADIASGALLNGARVVALDANRAPLSTVAVTAGTGESAGAYDLEVRATRDATGKPAQAFMTLRADAQGYQTFPGGVRTALPTDLASATLDSATQTWRITSLATPLTTLKLVPLTSGGTALVHGSVARPPSGAGALVVAEPAGGGAGAQTGLTGVADEDGNYAIFNLASGTQYVVSAYTKGANYIPVTTVSLAAGDNAVAALALGGGSTASFDGGLIFNNGATSPVSVTLTVESTYVSSLDRGESPPGLTVTSGASGYSFTGVPDGKYRVLAAFDVDGDVRNISGTGNTASPLVTIEAGAVVGGASSAPSFKIIPAVHLLTIGGTSVSATPAVATVATPIFTWQKGSVDSSAATYRVLVFDSLGNEAWSEDIAAVSSHSIPYAGQPLVAGMYYQLRILAIKEGISVPSEFTQLSQTEDLLGVFIYQP